MTLSNLVALKEILLKNDSRLSSRRNIQPWLRDEKETKNVSFVGSAPVGSSAISVPSEESPGTEGISGAQRRYYSLDRRQSVTPASRVSAFNCRMMALTVQHVLVGVVLAPVTMTREERGWSVCRRVWL